MALVLLTVPMARAQTYPSPLSNTATVAAPADVADPVAGNNTATDSNVLALQARLSISKSVLTPSPVIAGGAVQYRIAVSNQGPSVASAISVSDNVAAVLTAVSWTCTPSSAASSCAQASGTGNAINTQITIGVGDSVVLLVSATAPSSTPATVPANTASLILPAGLTDPDPADNTATTAPIPVQAAALVANNDVFTVAIDSATGGTTPSVLGNDTLAGSPLAAGSVIVSLLNAPAGYAVASSGVVTVPANAAAGARQLDYQICETVSPSNCATASIALVVTPRAVNDSFNVAAGSTLTASVAGNDNAPAGALYTVSGTPPMGLSLQGDGQFTYAPTPGGITAPASFQYQVCLPAPNGTTCSTATVSIVVDAAPLDAVDDSFASSIPTTGGSTPSVLDNDLFNGSRPQPAQVQLSLVGAPAGYTIAGTGAISVPANAAAGAHLITYQLCEAALPSNCDTATARVVVAPAAVGDSFTSPGAGQPVSGSVASNDSIASGSSYSVSVAPTLGTLQLAGDGSFTYTPENGNTGTDTFTYQVCLPTPDVSVCATALVTVQIGANAIVAVDDLFSTPIPSSGGTTPSVLGNDTRNGGALAANQVVLTLLQAPDGFTLAADGAVQVPAHAPAGPQQLRYRVCELASPGNCAEAAVQLLVAPDAVDDIVQATAGVALTGSVASNDNPANGGIYSLLVAPLQGTAVVNADGTFTYTAQPGYSGQDSFQYQLCLPTPNAGICDTATVSIGVGAAVVDAVDDDFRTSPLTGAGGLTASVLGNDTVNGAAVEPAQMSFVLTGTPPLGFVLDAQGRINVPAGAAAGPLQLQYQLCEAGTSNCDSASVQLVIAPDAVDDAFSTLVGRAVSGSVAANDNVPSGATFAVLGTVPAGLQFGPNGSFTYAPPAQFTGATTFAYRACLPAPDAGICDTASVTVQVAAGTLEANDDDLRSMLLNPATGGTTISVLANDTYNGAIPPDPSEVELTLVGAPAGYVINSSGTISVPAGAAAGVVQFSYQACERALPGNCDSAQVQLLLAPVAVNDNFSTQAGVILTASVASNDNAPPGSSFQLSGNAPAGLQFAADGGFTYTPPTGSQGMSSFAYQVCLPAPDTAVCATAAATLNVNAGSLDAVDDDFSASAVDPASGGSTPSVLGNDVLDGSSPPPTAAVLVTLLDAPAGFSVASDGSIVIPAGAAAGAVTVTYQLCEAALPSNCDTARARLLVLPLAAGDVFSTPAGQLLAGNVASNDNAPVGAVFSVQGTLPTGLVFAADGSFQYMPPADFTGPVNFTYQLCLPAPDSARCSTAAVTLNVNAGTLQALDDDFTAVPVAPGASTTGSVLANDALNGSSPVSAGAVSMALVGAPAGFALDATGRLQVPGTATAGRTVLTYQLCERTAPGNCASAAISMLVTPRAANDTLSVAVGGVLDATVADNDNLPAGALFSVSGAMPAGLQFSDNGSFRYAPPAGTSSPVSFDYQACLPAPDAALCATATATITLNAGTLVAVDDDFSASPIDPRQGGTSASVLGNDSLDGSTPPDAARVLLSLAAAPAGFSIDAQGRVVVAAGSSAGAVSLTYQLCEAALPGNCDTAQVRVLVMPVAVADALSTLAGQTLTGNVGDNDVVAAGALFSLTTSAPPGLQFNADGSFSYTPPVAVASPVIFGYQQCLPAPDAGVCAQATVTLNINNGALDAVDDDFTALAVAPGAATGSVLANDSLNGVTPPAAATVQLSLSGAPTGYSIAADGSISVPLGTLSGLVQLTYQVCEVAAPTNCDTAVVSVLVAPQPQADVLSTPAGQVLTASIAGNDNMPPGSVYSVIGAAPSGLVLGTDGSVVYTPPVGVTSPVTFTYQACLPAPFAGNCASAAVSINVNNGTLLAMDDDFTATPLLPGQGSASVLGNDALNGITPPAATSVQLSLVAAPAGVSIASDGGITVSAGQVAGPLTLTYQLCEAVAPTNCDSAEVRLLLAPVPADDSLSTRAGVAVSGDASLNDNVPQGAQFTLVGAAPAGLQFAADGRFTYSPPVGVSSPVTFTYQVCLPAPFAAVCATAAVSINVTAGSLAAVDDDFSATPLLPGAVSPSVLGNDSLEGVSPPASGDVLLTLQGAPAGYTMNANGSIGLPAAASSGAVVLAYQLCEAAAPSNCATAQVRLLVQPVATDDVVSTLAGQAVSGNLAANDNVPAGALYSIPAGAPDGLVLAVDGSFTYTPPVGVPSPLQVAYQVCLPAPDAAVCSTATVTLTINNGALEATDDDFSASPLAPGATTPSVLGNDTLNGTTPPAAASVLISLVGAPAGYSIDAAGSILVPQQTPSGPVTLTYQLCEAAAPGNCDSASVIVLVAPQPQADVVSTPAGQTVVGMVGSNDAVPPGSVFSLVGSAPPGLVFNADGGFSFAPPIGVSSPVSFQYRVCLPAPYTAVCATAGVTINVNNGALAAADDDFSATPITAGDSTASVLGNDSLNGSTPPASTAVRLSLVAAPPGFSITASGAVQVASGTVAGAVLLTYQVCEAAAPSNCDTAQVRVVVTPQPQTDSRSVAAGQTLVSSVAGNDNLPAGAVFSLASASIEGLVFNADGSFSYAPPSGTNGAVGFTYQVCLPAPDAAVCATAQVSIVISTAALVVRDDDFRSTPLPAGSAVPSVLANDSVNGSTPSADAVILSLLAAPTGYAIAVDGVISVPATAASGAVDLTYQLCEAAAPGNCATAQVRLVLVPSPANDVFSTPAGQALTATLAANDAVPVGATYSVPAGAPAGLALNADGSFTYTPPVGVASPVVFTYQVCLPAPYTAVCGTASATLNVNNGALSANDDDFTTAPLAPGATSPSVLGNDSLNGTTPPAPASVILSLMDAPAGFSIAADGSVTVAAGGTSGLQVVTYQLCEAAAPANCDTAQLRLLLAPQPQGDVVSTPAGQPVSGSVASNDNVPTGAQFSIPGGAPVGLSFNPDGSFNYVPPAGTTGIVNVTYQVCLPTPYATVCASATLTLNVNNGALVAQADDFSTTPITAGGSTPSVLGNDSLDGVSPPVPASVLLSLVGAPAGYAILANGTISVPATATSGAVVLTYQLCQSAAPDNCDSTQVRLLLSPQPVNDVQSLPAGGVLVGNVGDNDNVPAGARFGVVGALPSGLSFNADGGYVYTPPVGTTGAVTVTYQVCLPAPDAALCATATLTFNITTASVVATNDDFRSTPINAGGSTPSVLANDSLGGISPPPAGTFLLSLAAAPSGFQIGADGSIQVASGTASGAVALDYQLCEAAAPGNCSTATVLLIVAPQPLDDAVSTLAGQPVNGNVALNDGMPAGSSYSLTAASPPGLQFAADGSFIYTPPVGGPSPLSFSYQACLPAPDASICGTATVTLTVNNGALSAVDDDFSALPLAAGATTPSVLANDTLNGVSPPASAAVSLSLVGAPTGYVINADGSINLPTGTSAGARVLTYQLCEVAAPGNCDSATVRVVVLPQPAADVVSTPVGQAVNGAVGGNDNVPPGAVFSVLGTAPTGLVFNADGSFTYAPPTGVSSPVRFDYQVCLPAPDSTVCGTASVTLNINNGALLAADDDFSGNVLQPGATTPSVLVNDSLNGITPPPASAVRLSLVGAPTGFSINGDGTISIAGSATSGAVALSYQLCETLAPANCDTAMVRVLLAPAPANDVVPVQAGQSVTGSVAANDNVPPGAQFSVLGTTPAGLLFNTDGSFSYAPPAGTTGTVTLSYRVCLPAPDVAVCATASLSFTVGTGALDVRDDDFRATPIVPGANSPSVLGNDALNGVSPPAAGSVLLSLPGAPAGYTINADGSLQVPVETTSGAVNLTYQLCEAAAPSNCATAQVRLLLVPVPADDVVSTLAGQSVTGSVAGNDRLPPGAAFSVVGALPAGLSFNADGSFSYAPPTGVSSPVSFRYQVCLPAPDSAVCATAAVSINVNNGTLLAADDDFTAVPVRAGGSTATVLANDSLDGTTPPASATVLLSLVGAPAGYAITTEGAVSVPAGALAGRLSLAYQVCEAAAPANCASAGIALLVAPSPVNDVVSTPAGRPTAGTVAGNDSLPAGSRFSVVGSAPAGLVFTTDGTFTYTPPSGFSGQANLVYQACLPAPDAAVCGSATLVINVNTGALSALADDFSNTPIVPGGTTPSVLANDMLDGVSPPAANSVVLSLASAPAGYAITADGVVSVPTGVISGPVTLTYQLCEAAAPGNCDTATISLLLAPAPQADTLAVQAGQSANGRVGDNDNVPPGAQFSVVGSLPAGLQFNVDGSYSYAPPAGTTGVVSFTYQVCLPAPNTAVCATAQVQITIGTGSLLAVDDDFRTTPIVAGGSTGSVLGNDVLDGVSPIPAAQVLLSLPAAPAGYAIAADGSISTPVGAMAGAVNLTYQVCEVVAPSNCTTAQARLLLQPMPANDVVSTPVGQAVSGDVSSNDRMPAGATYVLTGAVPPGLQFNADGSFTYTPPEGTSGTVNFSYQACLPAPDTAVCGSASVTINVNTGSVLAVDDDFRGTPVLPGTSTPSVLGNDTLDGASVDADDVRLSLVGAPAGYAIATDGRINVPSGTLAGAISLGYQLCEAAAPSNCANATVQLLVVPVPLADVVSTPAGQPTTGNLGSNDNVPPGAQFSVVGSPPAGLVLAADGTFSYTPPAGTLGQVVFSYQVCLPAPDSAVCGTASVTLNINNGALSAVVDDFSGTPVLPGGLTPSVLANDLLNAAAPMEGSVSLTLIGAPGGYGINPDGRIVVPSGTTSGTVTLTYQLCEVAAPGNCDSTQVALLLIPVPVADAVSARSGETTVGNVGSNDNLPPGAQFTVVGGMPPGLQFNVDGSFSYTPPTGSSGSVSFTYQACLPAPNGSVCGSATVTLTVAANVVLAVNDDFSATPVDPAVGGTISRSVIDNDTFNGVSPPPLGSVTATLVGSTPGFTMNNQGQIMVAPGAPAGLVQLAYQLCENGVPGNCATAIASVRVQGPVGALLAVDDSGGPIPAGPAVSNLLNVLSNDTLNAAPLDPARVSFVPVATPALSFDADGALNVAAGLAAGTYTTTYTICLLDQPTVCATGTVSVRVVTAITGVDASDDAVEMPQNGVVEINVLGNDRVDGSPIDPATVVVTIISPPPFGTAELLPQARIRFAVAANFAGTQAFQYQVCEVADPTACATATVTVTVAENQLQLADDAVTLEATGPLLIDVLANDRTAGAPLDPASLQIVVQPGNGSVSCTGGRCTYTPSAGFFGTDSFRYRVCDVSVPTPACAEANVAVTVAGEQATLRLTKIASKRSAQIGDLVRYTITVDNVGDVDANGVTLLDTLPPGFTYTSGGFSVIDADNSGRSSGVQPLRIDGIDVAAGAQATVVYYLRIGAGTGTGVHTNRITAVDGQGRSIANVASADVDIRSDPLLDESLIVGSVFDDRNGNGIQDAGERGVPGVRVASVEGLLMETDAYGRYHLLGIEGGQVRGRNFILKVDVSTLPAGSRFTTPNPLVRRITPGVPARFDFGVLIADGALGQAPGAAPLRTAVLEFSDALFTAGSSTIDGRHAAVLDQAARALVQAQGGLVTLLVSPGQQALAQAREAALARALVALLPPGLGDRVRVQVVPVNETPGPAGDTTRDDGKGR